MASPIDPAGSLPAWLAEPGSASNQTAQPASKVDPNQIASKDAFLRLLVAQIKHQNPLSPADGLQFVSQLAQFSELEQVISIRQELEALRSQLAGGDAAPETPAPQET